MAALWFAFLMLLPQAALPSDGAGSSGGGHGSPQKGALQLRELVEGITCRWESGPKFFGTYTSPDSEIAGPRVLLNQRMGYFFYFLLGDADALSAYYDEASQMNVCWSQRPLRALPESLRESVAAYDLANIDRGESAPTQIAIRIGYDLFLDESAFNALDEVNQEYLKWHEVLHAFIPQDAPGKMTKLRDFVSGLRTIDLAFPRRENGFFAYDLSQEFDGLVKEQRASYRALKANNQVDFALLPGFKSREEQTLERLLLQGDLHGVSYTLRRQGLDPNALGRSGTSLFHELIATLSHCTSSNREPICRQSTRFVELYLSLGADPDMDYSTGEWEPMPLWRYLLLSTNRAGREIRLEWADRLMAEKVRRDGKADTALLNRTLFRVVADNYLALSADRLLRWGADVNALDEQGRTPLLAAVEEKGHGNNLFASYPATHLIGVLLSHGADDSVRNAQGKTALEIMVDFGGPRRPLYDMPAIYQLGVRALKSGTARIGTLREEFASRGMPLP